MTPADRERIEAASRQQCVTHGLVSEVVGQSVRMAALAACRNVGVACHELGRESALGEIETALRELGAEVRTVVLYAAGSWAASITIDGQTRMCLGHETIETALLAAIDAVNEMRELDALARRSVL